MKRLTLSIGLVLALAVSLAGTAFAGHIDFPEELRDELALDPGFQGAGSPNDIHSDNMALLATSDDEGSYRMGTDLAFWGRTMVAGAYDMIRVYDIANRTSPRQVGKLACPGNQNDVSIWGNLVFVSVDSPRFGPECGAGPAPTDVATLGAAWEGIRIISIANRSKPTQIATVKTDCGSHTHTLVPDAANDRVLLYVLSYPLVQQADCSVASHRKISVVEVPLSNPTAARVVSTPDVSPAIGCHDVTVYMPTAIAAAACLTESQLWDISDPVNPRIVSHIVNPSINIHHSSTFSWDGTTMVLGDELGGAAAAAGCLDPHLPLGALWFYDVSDPAAPVVKSRYNLPEDEQRTTTLFCTAHNFNTIPLRNGRDVLVSAWYNGGTTVVDFTDAAEPTQLGYYIATDPVRSAAWSSYWFNGVIYANNFDASYVPSIPQSRGIDVLGITHEHLKHHHRHDRLNPQTMESIRR